MSDLQDYCDRLIAIGLSTGPAADFKELAGEMLNHLESANIRNKQLEARRNAASRALIDGKYYD